MQRIKTRPGSGMWEARPCRGLQYAGFSSAPLRRCVPSSISHRAGGVRGVARSRGRRSKGAHSTLTSRRTAIAAGGQCSHDSSDEGAKIPRTSRLSSVSRPDMTITPRPGIMIDTSLCIPATLPRSSLPTHPTPPSPYSFILLNRLLHPSSSPTSQSIALRCPYLFVDKLANSWSFTHLRTPRLLTRVSRSTAL